MEPKKREEKEEPNCIPIYRYDSSDVLLIYRCPECGTQYQQCADEVVESGTAYCPGCECDCTLVSVELGENA